jgi:hypothetical protein
LRKENWRTWRKNLEATTNNSINVVGVQESNPSHSDERPVLSATM